jgi:hypothetical protein
MKSPGCVKSLVPLLLTGLLTACSHKYSYSGTIEDAERAVAAEPLGLIHLTVEARGTNWIRYRMVRDTSGIWLTNGAATMRVEADRVILRGSSEVRGHLARALKLESGRNNQ